jgi:predicted nucleic acid-binding protein
MSDKAFLDTNVLVYAYDLRDALKHQQAQRILNERMSTQEAVISAQVLGEFFVTVTKKIKQPLSVEAASTILGVLRAIPLVAIDRALVDAAVALHRKDQVSYWDALIIAAAQQSGCEQLLSEDMANGQQFGSVTIVNPFRLPQP